ncbi:MAG: M20/M25/M40 family metallo-hydrolase [Magnetococcales bacterium]|nr:M20/M25/M40 family metallo-hydrolase [Magnetococcales bacterium]MBF0322782.1 M20/M25/M40 family metallo-hydrolase [Magnetococcales bacterium]
MRPPLFSLLQHIVDINSHTANKAGVDAVGAFFQPHLEALGYAAQRHKRTHIGHHWHYRSPTVPGQKILLVGHLDTVALPDSPATFREDAQWVYGPGVCDMKGGLIVLLEALRQLDEKTGPIRNIDILLVSDEETGSDDSRSLTLDIAQEYDFCLVFEAAGRHGEVVIGRKGVGSFILHIAGVAAHSGNDHALGVCANTIAAHAILALAKLADPAQKTTLNVGRMEGGVGINTISPTATLKFELRYTSESEKMRLLRAIDTLVTHPPLPGGKLTLEGGIQRELFSPDMRQSRLLEALRAITGDPLPTEVRGGVSDANLTHAAGTVTLDGFGPFGEWDHSPRERALKESFFQRILLVFRMLEHHQRHACQLA